MENLVGQLDQLVQAMSDELSKRGTLPLLPGFGNLWAALISSSSFPGTPPCPPLPVHFLSVLLGPPQVVLPPLFPLPPPCPLTSAPSLSVFPLTLFVLSFVSLWLSLSLSCYVSSCNPSLPTPEWFFQSSLLLTS